MIIKKKAYAKVNLTLDVLGKRDDGYHDIVSIMQSVSLSDELTMERTTEADGRIEVAWSREEPCDEKNTVFRACKLMLDRYKLKGGVKVYIEKNIPVAAGLGGGSADAAAALEGMNELFDLKLTDAELQKVGVRIGADVPFCISKGAAIAEGIGERLVSFDAHIDCYVVLVKPDINVSTKEVYEQIDNTVLPRRPDTNLAIGAMKASDFKNLGQNLYNVMEFVTAKRYPIVREIKQRMTIQGANGALMSGSGPTVYGIFQNRFLAENALSFFKSVYPDFESNICEFYFPSREAARG